MMNGYGLGMWSMWSTWIFALLAIAGLVVLVVVLVRVSSGGTSSASQNPNSAASPGVRTASAARQILDERYAKGELTTEEYQERLTVLGNGH